MPNGRVQCEVPEATNGQFDSRIVQPLGGRRHLGTAITAAMLALMDCSKAEIEIYVTKAEKTKREARQSKMT